MPKPRKRTSATDAERRCRAVFGLSPRAGWEDILACIDGALTSANHAAAQLAVAQQQLIDLLLVTEFRGYDFSPFSFAVARDHLLTLKASDLRAVAAERKVDQLTSAVHDSATDVTNGLAAVQAALTRSGLLPKTKKAKTKAKTGARKK